MNAIIAEMLKYSGKQFKLDYYLQKDTFLPLERGLKKKNTNKTLKILKYIVIRCFLTTCSSA